MRRQKYNKGKNISIFIVKLHQMLEQRQNHHLIRWTTSETSFIINKPGEFSRLLLPQYYKHNNYSSFLRQLNMYNFNKIRIEDEGQHIFQHSHFIRGDFFNHKKILRKEYAKEQNNAPPHGGSHYARYQNTKMLQNGEVQDLANIINRVAGVDQNFEEYDNFFASPLLSQMQIQSYISGFQLQVNKEQATSLSVQQLQFKQVKLKQMCINLINSNNSVLSEGFYFEQAIFDEAKNNRVILETISKFIVNYYEKTSDKIVNFYDPRIILNLLDDLQKNYEHHIFFYKESKMNKLFMQFIKFIENNDISFVIKCLTNFLNIQMKKKSKSFTIITKNSKNSQAKQKCCLKDYHEYSQYIINSETGNQQTNSFFRMFNSLKYEGQF